MQNRKAQTAAQVLVILALMLTIISLSGCTEVRDYVPPDERLDMESLQDDGISPDVRGEVDMDIAAPEMDAEELLPPPQGLNAVSTEQGVELTWTPLQDVARYEISIDDGPWMNVGKDPFFLDEDAPSPEFISAKVNASDAEYREHVLLSVQDLDFEELVIRRYKLRAILFSGVTAVTSVEAGLEPYVMEWQWEGKEEGDDEPWQVLEGLTGMTEEYRGAPGGGDIMSYRVMGRLSDEKTFYTQKDEGSRLAVVQLSSSYNHNCVVMNNGEVRCWGRGGDGRLGYGGTENVGAKPGEMPPPDLDLGMTSVEHIIAGLDSTCVKSSEGEVKCWGLSRYNQETIGDEPGEMPPSSINFGVPMTSVDFVSSEGLCGLTFDGNIRCLGYNTFGVLCIGAPQSTVVGDESSDLPPTNSILGGRVVRLYSGYTHHCAVMESGDLVCWGWEGGGALGNGSSSGQVGDEMASLPPEPVSFDGMNKVDEMSLSTRVTCALYEGEVLCWGGNENGELRRGDTENLGDDPGELESAQPIRFNKTSDVDVVDLDAGWGHVCALFDNGEVTCWGNNNMGQLGIGSVESIGDERQETSGALSIDLGGAAKQVVTGFDHSCALMFDGEIKCWGGNSYGQLGYGSTESIGDEPGEMPPPNVPIY